MESSFFIATPDKDVKVVRWVLVLSDGGFGNKKGLLRKFTEGL